MRTDQVGQIRRILELMLQVQRICAIGDREFVANVLRRISLLDGYLILHRIRIVESLLLIS